jgi:hypothetical protein
MAATDIKRGSGARAVQVTLTNTVEAEQLAYVDGFLGVTFEAGESDDVVALDREPQIVDLAIPSTLYAAVSVGDWIYFDSGEVTGHTLNDAALTDTATDNVRLMKVIKKISGTDYTIRAVLDVSEV